MSLDDVPQEVVGRVSKVIRTAFEAVGLPRLTSREEGTLWLRHREDINSRGEVAQP
jgi:hypothetical protein